MYHHIYSNSSTIIRYNRHKHVAILLHFSAILGRYSINIKYNNGRYTINKNTIMDAIIVFFVCCIPGIIVFYVTAYLPRMAKKV
jgi:hypothetical protein